MVQAAGTGHVSDASCVYTTDGELNIDNNPSENALRRVAIGRKNGLFAGSDKGGRTAAALVARSRHQPRMDHDPHRRRHGGGAFKRIRRCPIPASPPHG